MGQDPDAIRQEIERTREEMGETIDAVGYKADVPARSKEAVNEKVDNVKSSVTGGVDTVKEKLGMGNVKDKVGSAGGRLNEATPSTGEVKAKGRQAVGVAKSNPIGLGLGALAVGFLAGMLIPETAKEHEKLGPAADNLKDTVKETAQEAV